MEPEKKFKVGGCIVSVFARTVETGAGPVVKRRLALQRVYRTPGGEYRYASSFRVEDVPKLVEALKQAVEAVG